MNKIDLCSAGGVKSQKCEQTIVGRTKFFQQFIPKYLVIQCTQGFSKKLKNSPKKLKDFPKKLKDFRKNSMLRRLPASVGLQKNVQKISRS